MKKLLSLLFIIGLSFNFVACNSSNALNKTKEVSGKAWEGTKEVSGKAWEGTKKGTKKAWKSTKKAIHEATAEDE